MVTPAPGAESKIAELVAGAKAAREAVQSMFPDTAERLGRLEAALEAQQDRESK